MGGGSACRNAATYTQNKRTLAAMPWAGFEPVIPAFEIAKTVHALDRTATVIDIAKNNTFFFQSSEV
jgi:hypothetical protein